MAWLGLGVVHPAHDASFAAPTAAVRAAWNDAAMARRSLAMASVFAARMAVPYGEAVADAAEALL